MIEPYGTSLKPASNPGVCWVLPGPRTSPPSRKSAKGPDISAAFLRRYVKLVSGAYDLFAVGCARCRAVAVAPIRSRPSNGALLM